jgi:hypothetical protein
MSLQLYVASSMAATTNTHHATPTMQRPATSTPRRFATASIAPRSPLQRLPVLLFKMQRPTVHRTTHGHHAIVDVLSPTRPPTITCNCISSVPVVTASMPRSTFLTVATFYHARSPRNVPATQRSATSTTIAVATFHHCHVHPTIDHVRYYHVPPRDAHRATPTTQRPATSTPRPLQRSQLPHVHHCNVVACYFSTCNGPPIHLTTMVTTVTTRSSMCCPANRQHRNFFNIKTFVASQFFHS